MLLTLCHRLLAARYGGPGEGVYHCHPQHMHVRMPRNINDADLLDHDLQFEHLPSHPTDMSYFLQRIRLAETARAIVDRNPLSSSDLASANPTFDVEIDQLLNDLPPFFRLSTYNATSVPSINSNVFVQAYMLTSLVHTQRCKTHLTHLTSKSTFTSSSRAICLDSARHILAAERLLLRSQHSFVRVRLRLAAILYGVFIACIALLMDTCVHRPAALEDELRHGDVADALHILEGTRKDSLAAEKVWEGLMGVLNRYRGTMQQRELQRVESSAPLARLELDGSIWDEAAVNRGTGAEDEISQGAGQDVANEWYDFFSDLSSSSASSFF
jgi:hypothetical protein